MLFFSREATSDTYDPRVSTHHICLRGLLSFAFSSSSIKPKIQKYLAALHFICDLFILSITTLSRLLANLRHRHPKGIDNPFNTPGCEYLLFVCRGCLRCVAWFSYWFDNLGFITEGNTYRCCAASSLPLWGNTDVVQANIKRNFWRCCWGASSTYTRFLITNLISSQFTLFSICLSFSSPPLHKNLSFYSPSFLFVVFLSDLFLCVLLFA